MSLTLAEGGVATGVGTGVGIGVGTGVAVGFVVADGEEADFIPHKLMLLFPIAVKVIDSFGEESSLYWRKNTPRYTSLPLVMVM